VPSRPIRVLPLFAPLGPRARAESVARQLADAIHLGLVSSGEQLPSEGMLASHLGVSTMTLREALATLREQGLVETRRGRNGGSFVCSPGSPSVASLRSRLRAMSATELRDMGDERLAIAGTSALLAARRASDANLRRMASQRDQLAQAKTIGARARAHSRFWIELAIATQSERLTHAAVRLQSAMGELLWLPKPRHLDQRVLAGALGSIAAAVSDEDEARARAEAEAITDHTTRWLITMHLDLTRRER
jgi:GntR family transcriptional regulator, transcriptional repressor for pyruvate dehydrogenase complex